MTDKREERIKKLIENPNLTDWEKGFLSSISSYMEKHNRISNKQWATVQKVEANYSPEVIAQRQAWNDNFSDDMRQKWNIAMDYYESIVHLPKRFRLRSYIPKLSRISMFRMLSLRFNPSLYMMLVLWFKCGAQPKDRTIDSVNVLPWLWITLGL